MTVAETELRIIGDKCYLSNDQVGFLAEIEFPDACLFDLLRSGRLSQDRLLADLLQTLEIEPAENARVETDDHGDPPADDWGFREICRRNRFVDYGSRGAFSNDFQTMERYAAKDPPPELALAHPGTTVVALPAVERLLSLTFGAFGRQTFHNHEILLKTVPSMGGRHGLEAYLWYPRGHQDCAPGLYHFNSQTRRTSRIDNAAPPGEPSALPLLLITCVFERYQWRYRSSWVYQMIYLDLGHVLANLNVLARRLGLQISARPELSACFQGSFEPLVNEPVYALALSSLPGA